jgi:PKD repeat protein
MRKVVVVGLAFALLLFSPVVSAYKESDQLNGGQTTHQFIMDQIPTILLNDGHPSLGDFVTTYLDQMKFGSMRADETLWDSREHYMHPSTHNGYLTFKPAGSLAYEKFVEATDHWTLGDKASAFYDLGWSTHLVQDLTVPHHAYVTALNYHAEYEQWVYDNQFGYAVTSGGNYTFDSYLPGHHENELSPMDWVDYNAHFSFDYYAYVDGQNGQGDNDYNYAVSALLPRAQRTSAGYVYMFLSIVNTGPTILEAQDKNGGMSEVFQFSGSNAQDDMGIANYTWEFGDGSFGYGPDPTHLYSWPGAYLCNLTARDAFGLEVADQIVVSVRDDIGPIAVAGEDWNIAEGGTVHLDASGSWDNVGIVWYNWWLGSNRIGAAPSVDYTFYKYGVYTVTLKVGDNGSNSAEDSLTVVVVDVTAPVADAGPDRKTWMGGPGVFIGSNSTDNNDIVSYAWDFGDGSGSNLKSNWHEYKKSGTYTVTLLVQDAAGNSDTDTTIIEVLEGESPVESPVGITILVIVIIADLMSAMLLVAWMRKSRRGSEEE